MHKQPTSQLLGLTLSALLLGALPGAGFAETNVLGAADGSFETGLSGTTTSGDTRIVTGLGILTATEGAQALLLTTEPDQGSMPADAQESSLAISNFTIPAGYNTLRLDYNFLTNEPGPSFANDQFEVRLILVSAGGEEILLASDTFDNFLPAPWTGYDNHTGYRTMVADIAAHAGTADMVSLELRIADLGDGRRDSAVLIDNLRLSEPGTPVAAIGSTFYQINTGDIIVFDGSSSSDDVGIASYEWDFGNGFLGFGPLIAMDQYNERGFYQGKLTVTDAEGQSDTVRFNVGVGSINSAPEIVSTPARIATEGMPYNYQVGVADAEIQYGDVMTWSLTTAPAGMTIDPSTGLISWVVPIGADTQSDVAVLVTDSLGESDAQSYRITLGPQAYVATVSDDSRIYTALSQGDGTFASLDYLDDIGTNTRGVVIADFDGDDDFDLITGYVESARQHLFMYQRDGGGFSAPVYLGTLGSDVAPVGSYIEDMAAADFNNDGRMDFIANSDSTSLWYMENTGPLVTAPEDLQTSNFEAGNDGFSACGATSIVRDDTTSTSGNWSLRLTPTNNVSPLCTITSPSNWFLSRGSIMRFDYRIEPGSPVGLFFNVSGFGWLQMGGSPTHDPSTYPVSPEAVTLVDDGQWHTIEFDVYRAIRAYWPTAHLATQFEFWSNNNASLAAGHRFWLDDFRISRPRMVSGFEAKELPASGSNGRSLDAADVDLDGNMDFVRMHYSSGYADLYRGDGHGNFTRTVQVADPGVDPYGAALADFDGDNVPDLIANEGGGGNPYFFRGLGNGTFAAGVYVPSLDTNNYTSYGAFDFNGDGLMDIVTSNYSSRTVHYFAGNGDVTFKPAVIVGQTVSPAANILSVSAPAGRAIGQPFGRASQDVSLINEGETVNFDGSDSYDDGSVVDYAWEFGDGATANGPVASHLYSSEGNYDVVLTVTDDEGQQDRFNLRVTVNGNAPVADAGGPYLFDELAALNGRWYGTLNGTDSSDDETSIAGYAWDFDASDGISIDSTMAFPRVAYDAPGTYTVTLTVFDEVGLAATTTDTVTIEAGAEPVAGLVGPGLLNEGDASLGAWTGIYGASTTTDDVGVRNYEIAWGDGATSALSPLADDFNDNNFTGWTVNGGTWSAGDGELAQTALNVSWRWMQDLTRTYRDFQLEVDFKATAGPSNGYMGIVFRNANTSASTSSFLLYSQNSWDFWRFYNWGTGTILADGGTGWDPEIWYHLRLVMVGETMQLYVTPEGGTETLQLEATSPAFPVGGIGLLANDQNLRYDNVKVTPLDALWTQNGRTTDDFFHSFVTAQDFDVTLTATDHAGQADTALVATTVEAGLAPTADSGGPYTLDESDALDGRWQFILDASLSSDDHNVERYRVDFGDGTVYTTGANNGRETSYFATGTDLYGFDTVGANLQRIIATENNTLVEIVNLATGTVISSTTLNRMQVWSNVTPGDGVYFKVRATKPVTAYFTNLSNHAAFIPSMDGSPVGKEFIYHHDTNQGFYVFAFEDSVVSFYNSSNTLLQQHLLRAGEYRSISASDTTTRVVATGRVSLQTTGDNGYTTVPSESGDGAGQLFYFAIQSSSTGSIAVFAHENADIEVFDLNTGASLYTASVAAGDMWYQNGVGTRRMRLVSTADVEVWAGDNEGGAAILDLGDDLSFAGGRNGNEFVLHNLRDGIVIFAPNDSTEVTVDGAVVATLDRDEFLPLAPTDFASGSGVHRIQTSAPVVIQTLGRANTFNDLGTYLGGVSMRHQYLATGIYDVTLDVTDNAGQTSTIGTTVEVLANDLPVPEIVAPAIADESYASGGVWTVEFDASSSTDDYGISSYQWNFGDGGTATGAEVSHGYAAAGTYDVTLTVTDHGKQSVQLTRQVVVQFGAGPTADAGGPYVFGEESASYGVWTATLDASGSTDNAGIFRYVWEFPPLVSDDFEDGILNTTDWVTGSNATESAGVLTVVGPNNWTAQGFRQAQTIDREAGLELTAQVRGSGSIMIGLYGEAPANFNYPLLRHSIYFAGGNLYIYEDGSQRGHVGTYTQGQWYDIRIVLRAAGVDYFIRPVGAVNWTQLTSYSSLNSTSPRLMFGASVNSGTWNFDNIVGALRQEGQVVTRTFDAPTVIPVTLTVFDNALQTDVDTTTVTIIDGAPPVANAGGPYTAEVGAILNFNGTQSSDDAAVQTYEWVFGDTTGGPAAEGSRTADLPYTATGPTPRHFYRVEGTYDVQLVVTDNTLKSDVATTTVNVVVGDPPVAQASVSGSPGAGGPPAYFDGRSSNDDFGIVEYRWDFDAEIDSNGDGNPTNDIDAVGARAFHNFESVALSAALVYGEDFEGVALDSSKWISAGATQSGGTANITGVNSWTTRYLTSTDTFDRTGQSFRGQVTQSAAGGNAHMMWGLKTTNSDPNYTQMPHAIYFNNGSVSIYENGSHRGAVASYTRGVQYDARIDLKPAGADYYFRETGAPGWILINPPTSLNATTTPLRIHATIYSVETNIDNIRVETRAPYVATLTVEDGAGQTSSSQVIVPVAANTAPDVITVPWVAFDPLAPHETYNGKTIRLKGIVRDADPVSYQWSFGDGTSSAVTPVTNSFNLSVTHTYPDAPSGTPFTATLTVTDSAGNVGTATYPIIVRPLNLNTEINVAIDEGLWYLHQTQTRTSAEGYETGYWTSNARASATASAIQAFQVNGHLESTDHAENPYAETVMRGLRQLFRDLGTINILTQTFGEPDTNGNGIGIETGVNGSGGDPIYQGGQVMDAIATSGNPLARTVTGAPGIKRRSYFDILTDMADAFAWGQTEQGQGGGWRYSWNSSIDNSAAQWGAIGLVAAEDIFGVEVPLWVKEQNTAWLNYAYGSPGWGYTTGGATQAGTPSGLVQLILNDQTTNYPQWQPSENWIADNWNSQYFVSPGNRPYYPYYALTKAMRLAKPEAVEVFHNGFDWFRDEERGLARTLIDDQLASGQFPGSTWISDQLRSAWGVIILSRSVFVQPPVADAGRDRVWGVDIPLNFDGSNSFHLDPFRSIVRYEWDFDGDGTFDFESDEPFATHTYFEADYPEPTLPRTILARLRVTDNNVPALTDTDTIELIIAIPPHPPVAEAGGPYTCTAGLPCQLDGSGSTDIDPTDFIARYEWDLDGFPFDYQGATGANPEPVFAVGLHNIGLQVWDNGVLNDLDGDDELDEDERLSDVDFATVNTVPNLPPVANANGPYSVDEGSVVVLSSAGSSDPNGDPILYQWDLDGDGAFDDAIGPSPSFLGVDDGANTIALRITDTLLEAIATSSVTVNNVPPTVDAGADQAVDEGVAIVLGGSFTDPGTLDTHTIEWDFGDGNSSIGTLTPSHAYTDDGTYTVTLTVTDDDGGIGMDSLIVTVGDRGPNAVLTGDQNLLEGGTGTFDASASSSSPDAIAGYEWDFGFDGAFDPSGVTGPTVNHTFPDNGTFTIAVRVTDDDGSTSIATLPVTVANVAPVVEAGAGATLDEGDPFIGAGSFSDPGADIWTATVDYGDGTGPQPLALNPDGTFGLSHTYLDDGAYTVTVAVTDDDGGVGVDTLLVNVNDLSPIAVLSGDENLLEGATGLFDASASASSPDAITSFEWDFAFDGSFDPSGASGPTAARTFADDGNFIVAVRVTDDDGSTSIATLSVTVANVAPVVDAGPDVSINEGDTFAGAGSFADPGADTWAATVDYGDGAGPQALALNADKTFALSNTYATAGTYTVTVTVTDDDGGVGVDTLVVTAGDVVLVANVVGEQSLLEGETGSFDASGSNSSPFAIESYEWDFAYDGTFEPTGESGPTANHTFVDNGNFVVAVRVTNEVGGVSVATLPVSVANVAPVVDAGPDAAIDEGDGFVGAGSFVDPGADTWSATVDYGDGTGSQPLALNPDKTFGLAHTYGNDGVFTATVTVTDDDGGVGVDTLTVTVNAGVVVDPPAPSNLTARPKNAQVQLVWSHVGADSYNVYRSLTAGGPYTLIANTTSTYSTYLNVGLTNGTRYYYVVRSVAGGSESSTPSNEASAVPSARAR